MEAVYPVFLRLGGVPCLVVGGGPVGARKASELRAAGALVTVVSPRLSDEWQGLEVEHRARAFRAGDARGMRLVVAATGDPAVDDEVAADARREGALVNAVDRTPACDFFTAAVVRRGPLLVAIGTGGASPALARKVRQRLEGALPEPYGHLAAALGEARPRLCERYPDFATRARTLDAFVDDALHRITAGTTREEIERWIEALISAASPLP